MLQCRPGTTFSLESNDQNAQGLILAMDLRPLSSGQAVQSLFSIRDQSTNYIALTAEYNRATKQIDIQRVTHSGWQEAFTSTGTLTEGINALYP